MIKSIAVTRMLLLGVALLASGGCTSTHLTGTLMGRPFVARGAYTEAGPGNQLYVYATQYEEDVLESKKIEEGELVLVVQLPHLASGKLSAKGQRTPAQVAVWKFSWWSPAGQTDWRYGSGTVEVMARSLTKIHLRVDANFPRGGAVSGDIVASVRPRKRTPGGR